MNLRKLEVNLNKLYEKIPNDMIKMLLGIFYFRSSFILGIIPNISATWLFIWLGETIISRLRN